MGQLLLPRNASNLVSVSAKAKLFYELNFKETLSKSIFFGQ
jgi:hypothetical protein